MPDDTHVAADMRVQPGMQVVALDGPVGVLERRTTPQTDATAPVEELVVRDQQGRYRQVLPAHLQRSVGETVYLDVPAAALPTWPVQPGRSATEAADTVAAAGETLSIPLAEEQLTIGTRVVELGQLQVHKRVEELLEQHRVPVQYQEAEVERIAVDRVVERMPEPFMDGDVLVVPIVEEEIVEVVVQRRLRVVEEVRIRRQVQTRQETLDIARKHETVTVDERWQDPDTRRAERGVPDDTS